MTRPDLARLWKDACLQSAGLDTTELHYEIFARMVTAHWAEKLKQLASDLDLADYIARGRHTIEAQLVYDLIEEMEAEAE